MENTEKIQAGSLDIDDVRLSLGAVETDSLDVLRKISNDFDKLGNKFVIAEHFVSPEGQTVDAQQFDTRTCCYSLFVAPIYLTGRHYSVIPFHEKKGFHGRTRKIVGGGLVTLREENLNLCVYSTDFQKEPDYLRKKFSDLLLSELSQKWNAPDLRLAPQATSLSAMYDFQVNPYWFRYRQVLDAAKEHLDATQFGFEMQKFKYSSDAS